MNRIILAGLVLAGAVIAADHLTAGLPGPAAKLLYTVAVVLFIVGMIKSKKAE